MRLSRACSEGGPPQILDGRKSRPDIVTNLTRNEAEARIVVRDNSFSATILPDRVVRHRPALGQPGGDRDHDRREEGQPMKRSAFHKPDFARIGTGIVSLRCSVGQTTVGRAMNEGDVAIY